MRTRLITCLAVVTALLVGAPVPASAAADTTQRVSVTTGDTNATQDVFVPSVAPDDVTPPVLSLPGPLTVEATSPGGATVTYTATAVDGIDPDPAVFCDPDSGTMFALGATRVDCTATDWAGNVDTGSFTVTVTDTTAPTFYTFPFFGMTVGATGPGGAAVTYTVTAVDIPFVDPNPAVVCIPASGTMFALGTTMVACTATDASGNARFRNFRVDVTDATRPTLSLPGAITADATGPGGAAVTYTVTAVDIADPNPAVSCTPASGATFVIGTTTVACTATDASGNTATGSFTVTVTDTTGPTLSLPGAITAVATGAGGAVVTYAASAADGADPNPAVSCIPASGSTFVIGTTTVACTSTDATGNTATGSFTVTVSDTTAPAVAITGKPAVLTSSATATFSFAGTDGTDPVGSLRYLCSLDGAAASACTGAATYTALTSGVHTFTVKVIDPSGNSSTATYSWRVDRVAPTLSMTGPGTGYALTTSLVPAWAAKDVGGGLANVDVRWVRAPYNGGFSAAVYPRTWQKTTATKATLAGVTPGYTYCFSARARDKAGNLSGWSAPRCRAVALDDRSLAASTGWTRATGSLFYRGTATVTSRPALTLTRTGVKTRRIYLVATRCPTCGTVGVYWNRTLIRKVSLYARATTRRSVLGITTFTGVRSGTLRIRTLTRNKAVQIDGVALLRG